MLRAHRSLLLRTTLLCVTLFAGCGDDPTAPIDGAGDPENISRVTVTLTPAAGSAFSANRYDPDGTQLPQAVGAASTTLVLHRGVTYGGVIGLLNDLDLSNVINISNEVTEEANFHRFFYALTCAGVTAPTTGQNRDTQSPAQLFGLTFQLIVAADAPVNAACSLNVQLHHFETDKGDGEGTNFETDLNIDFPVSVQP